MTLNRRVTISGSHPEDSKNQHDQTFDTKQRSKSVAIKNACHSPMHHSQLGSLSEDTFSEDFQEMDDERTRRIPKFFMDDLVDFEPEDSGDEDNDNSVFDWSQHFQNHAIKTSKRCERTPMGEYIPPAGSKPLTQLALETPGPSDYSPKTALSQLSAPQYSIVGKTKYHQEQSLPGPNNYETGNDLIWKNKTITIKGKGTMMGIKHEREDWDESVGPAHYNVMHGNFGSTAPKHAIGLKGKFCSGPPSSLIQPVDTYGFSTPGPAEYQPNPVYWGNGAEKSFGLSLRTEQNCFPGPAEYDIPRDTTNGPSYSIGGRLKENYGTDTPGPGSYHIGTTVGTSVAKSITGRRTYKNTDKIPSPNTYALPSSIGTRNMHTMTYRPFETTANATPGPAEYEPRNVRHRKPPEFTCRRHCKLSYPDVLHHWDQARNLNPDVSPNSYNPNRDFSKNDKPTYSIGKRFRQKIEDSPGPASYNVSGTKQQGGKKQPSISIGKRIEENIAKDGPGPAAYYPKPKANGPSYSMSGWNSRKQGALSNYPAANAYMVNSKQTSRGQSQGPSVTLKGRPSPFIYSGFNRPIQA